ncbi:uncharacterized protein SCHCODRAFT_01029157 [Schizophyllum commune H4-8]|uniref:Uncharacterized protein n=1 Tax=Schizophyllum commune (strain H4-8 / FGSC 9210) TaxID=578458 RepID=D8PLI3_SCHCM|nr:uncharacterized protein SCHCODRAFT_01029157 [Schizophyllum commune H4-8]KAI5894369.1 hypothetical protein SCHCODRAFT_01029157 [Schizophyllum commune H4-8]
MYGPWMTATRSSTNPKDIPDERHILISLVVTDLRPIKHPFEPYAHQFGCMYDTVRIRKAKGITSKAPESTPQQVEAAERAETPKKAVSPLWTTTTPKSTTTPKPSPTPKHAPAVKSAKTPAPVETPSRSSSGFSSYVSVNEQSTASDSAESFDMVDTPVEEMSKSEGNRDVTPADTRDFNSAGPHPSSFVESPATSGMSSATSGMSSACTTSANDLTSVVSRLSLADEPYPDPAYSISGHLAANKVEGAVGRAQHSPPRAQQSPPHAQRSPPRGAQTTPRRSEQTAPRRSEQTAPRRSEQTAPKKSDSAMSRKSEPVTPQRVTRATPQTSPIQDTTHAPRTPEAAKSHRKSKEHRRSSHTHNSPRTPELDTSPRTSPRHPEAHRTHATTPRSPEPLADLTTDQRNIILCIQKAYHKVGPHDQWIGVYHGDIGKADFKNDVVAQAASISNDIEILVEKGYITTTVDEDHFDCTDHSHGRYRRYTEILADLSLDDD